jgi:CheY-like chemotaxis protein
LKIGLERLGISVTAYNDPFKALEDAKQHHYDLVITDVKMPQMNGFELYQEIRKYDGKSPICFFSAFEECQVEFTQALPHLDAKLFLKKPVSISEIAKRIDELTSP